MAAFAVVLALSATVPAGAAPIGPVVNGDFELALPGKDVSCATFGDQQYNVLPPDQDPGLSIEDPTDPNSEIEVPWPWLVSASPCESGALKAVHWSSSRVSQWADHDGDGDREVLIDGSTPIPPDDSIGASHNFWQAYPSPHQAYSANFESLSFRVEAGAIPSNARVILSLSNSPLDVPSPYLVLFLTCQLTFRPGDVGEDGLVTMDPLEASFTSRDPQCDVLESAWNAGDDDVKRSVLGRTRIVQLSFWNFNRPDATVTLDDVSINGSRFFVEDAVDQAL